MKQMVAFVSKIDDGAPFKQPGKLSLAWPRFLLLAAPLDLATFSPPILP
jgi:hypothetical protein